VALDDTRQRMKRFLEAGGQTREFELEPNFGSGDPQ